MTTGGVWAMKAIGRAAILAAFSFWALSCRAGSPADPVVEDPPDDPGGLVLSHDLSDHCFRWPEADFSRRNYAQTEISLAEGEPAVEFVLEDLAGESHALSRLLATRPVVLVLGSFT